MNRILIGILLLTLYGDLLKRVLPNLALIILYLSVIGILVVVVLRARTKNIKLNKYAFAMCISAFMLIVLYIFQLINIGDKGIVNALTHALYMCIPLLSFIVILIFSPNFDLERFIRIFMIMIIPINIIGAIQYFYDPYFLISTAYDIEVGASSSHSGGVIERNLLYGQATFSRFPSIFASADRFSAVALLQFYFSFILFSKSIDNRKINYSWLIFGFCSSIGSLLISGARSRILIASIEVIFFLIVCSISLFKKHSREIRLKPKHYLFILISMICIGVYSSLNIKNSDEREEFLIIEFLGQSVEQRDLSNRIVDGYVKSLIPEKVSIFGEGLGTIGLGGKPGEFGIYSIWIESGLFWGSFMLMAFFGMIAILAILTIKEILLSHPIGSVIYSFPMLLLIYALLSGLTAVFEFSGGILLMCSMAAILRGHPKKRVNSISRA